MKKYTTILFTFTLTPSLFSAYNPSDAVHRSITENLARAAARENAARAQENARATAAHALQLEEAARKQKEASNPK